LDQLSESLKKVLRQQKDGDARRPKMERKRNFPINPESFSSGNGQRLKKTKTKKAVKKKKVPRKTISRQRTVLKVTAGGTPPAPGKRF